MHFETELAIVLNHSCALDREAHPLPRTIYLWALAELSEPELNLQVALTKDYLFSIESIDQM